VGKGTPTKMPVFTALGNQGGFFIQKNKNFKWGDLMLQDFIFSSEGLNFLESYRNKFNCSFRIEEPSGNAVILDVGEQSFKVRDDEKLEDFKAIIMESLKSGRNILIEHCEPIETENYEDLVY